MVDTCGLRLRTGKKYGDTKKRHAPFIRGTCPLATQPETGGKARVLIEGPERTRLSDYMGSDTVSSPSGQVRKPAPNSEFSRGYTQYTRLPVVFSAHELAAPQR